MQRYIYALVDRGVLFCYIPTEVRCCSDDELVQTEGPENNIPLRHSFLLSAESTNTQARNWRPSAVAQPKSSRPNVGARRHCNTFVPEEEEVRRRCPLVQKDGRAPTANITSPPPAGGLRLRARDAHADATLQAFASGKKRRLRVAKVARDGASFLSFAAGLR
ncbi:hypothetical protein MTO96_013599 [Rhipicephalus appendiculatus]